jgi:hypothetical protein
MKAKILAALCLIPAPGPVHRDVSFTIIEYRVVKELGQVRMTAGLVHDPAIQDRMDARREAFERKGIILVNVAGERRFVREEHLANHLIRTVVTLRPPIGRGYRGGVSTAGLLVTVDGRTRVDCSYDAGNVEISDLSIMAIDGFIRVRGTVDRNSIDELTPLVGDDTITDAWLMARTRR